jgi:glycosyltransferase involved in cell wall biosynthesis
LNILHVAPSVARSYGGPTYSLISYSRAAIATGAEITIAVPRPAKDDCEWLSGEIPEANQQLFESVGSGAFIGAPALHQWLRRNGSRFDVVHVHGLFNPVSSLSARECVRAGWPVVIRPFGTLSRYSHTHRRSLLKAMYFRVIERRNLRRASAIHFTTVAERDESAWREIEWGTRAFVIPPPWYERPNDVPRPNEAHSRTALIVARLNPIKNIEMLIDAWPLVRERLPDAQLVIAGAGEPDYVQALRDRAGGLSTSVRFVGFADDVTKDRLLRESAVFVLPSFHENFGIAVLEALAAGLPVVLTAEVQLSTFVREHRLGVVVEQSAKSFAEAIIAVMEDRAMKDHCRANGPAVVQHSFSPSAIGTRLLDMYDFAISHSPS